MPRNFPNWIDAYLDFTSIQESPEKFHFWTACWVIGSTLRRKVWFDQVLFEWIPNLYVMLVAPAGVVSKSTTGGIGERMLREIDGIHFGPKVLTWQELVHKFADSLDHFSVGGLMGEQIPMASITMSVSELGSFLDVKDPKMVDILVDLWDGYKGVWDKGTKTQGYDEIENPCISIHACSTPTWLRDNLNTTAIQGGLFSRWVIVYAEEKRHTAALLKDFIPDMDEFRRKRAALVSDLKQISRLAGEYHLSPEAADYQREWYADLWTRFASDGASDRIKGAYARRQTLAFKLAMILSAAKSDELIITLPTMREAIDQIESVRNDASLALGRFDESADSRHAQLIIEYIDKHGQTDLSKLYRVFWKLIPKKDFDIAIKAATSGRILRRVQSGEKIFLAPGENFDEHK